MPTVVTQQDFDKAAPPGPPANPQQPVELKSARMLPGGRLLIGNVGQPHDELKQPGESDVPPETQRGFIGPDGRFLDRVAAAKLSSVPTTKEAGRLHSEDLTPAARLDQFKDYTSETGKQGAPEGAQARLDAAKSYLAGDKSINGMSPAEWFLSGIRSQWEGLNQAVSHIPGVDKPEVVGANDARLAARDAELAQARKAQGTGGAVAEVAGEVVPTVIGGLGRLPASALGRIGAGAAQGGAQSAMTPTAGGPDFWKNKAGQTATGAAFGAAGAGLGEGLGKVISPPSGDARKLMDEGVLMTPGQMAGGLAKRAEDAFRSVPILGSAIAAGQNRSIASFNRTAINRTLTPIGSSLPKGLDAGHEAVEWASTKLNDAYNSLLPKLRGDLGAAPGTALGKAGAQPTLRDELKTMQKMGASMPKPQRTQLNRIIRDEITSRFTSDGKTTGYAVNDMQSKLGEIAKGMMASPDYDVRQLGGAVKKLQAAVRRMEARVNPEFAGEIDKIRKGWANLKVIQKAASSTGAKDGIFSPSMLVSASRAVDKSKDKAMTAKGRGLMQGLANQGRNVLPPSFNDSGTAERAMWAGMGLGGAAGGAGYFLHNPLIPAAVGLAALPYTGPGMEIWRAIQSAAPETREAIVRALQATSPAAGTVAAGAGQQ